MAMLVARSFATHHDDAHTAESTTLVSAVVKEAVVAHTICYARALFCGFCCRAVMWAIAVPQAIIDATAKQQQLIDSVVSAVNGGAFCAILQRHPLGLLGCLRGHALRTSLCALRHARRCTCFLLRCALLASGHHGTRTLLASAQNSTMRAAPAQRLSGAVRAQADKQQVSKPIHGTSWRPSFRREGGQASST